MNYNLARNNEQLGVFTAEEIQKGLANGTYVSSDLAWTAGMADWKTLGALPEFGSSPAYDPVPALPQNYAPASAASPVGASGSVPVGPVQVYPTHVSIGVAPTPGTAVASLVLGIISLVTCYFGILFAIPGLICGHMALKTIRESGNRFQGRGLAVAGLVLNYIWLGLFACIVIFLLIAGGVAAVGAKMSEVGG